jgi:hypothetical protein
MKLHGFYKQILLPILLCSSLYGFTQSYSYSCYVWGVDVNYVSRTVNTVSTINNGKSITGKYLTILGKNHTTVIKPYIIIEGIDFLNNQYFDSHISLFNNDASRLSDALICNLYNNGYDVLILDFDNSTDYIQNNAMLLVKLINDIYINNSLTEDNFVVMGYSMGGLVARYALTWMEANNQNHHTRLFVSHDAPQKGANFPLGLQEFVEDVKTNLPLGGLILDAMFLITFEHNCPAARQMLLYHYWNSANGIAKPFDDNITLFTELYNLSPSTNGYPYKPLKIATSNGNFNGLRQGEIPGITQGVKSGDVILDFKYEKIKPIIHHSDSWPWCGVFDFNGCEYDTQASPDIIQATVRAGFDGTLPLEKWFMYIGTTYPIGNTSVKLPIALGGEGEKTFFSNNYSYDNASGSYSPVFMDMIKSGIVNVLNVPVTSENRLCFIPTISALDLNIGVNEPFNLNSSQCYTNFDYIYANEITNSNHFSLQQGAVIFIMNHVLSNESPRQKYYFSAENLTIPNNQVINSGQSYNKTAKFDITNEYSFIVNSGASSTLIAGNSIEMKPGFTVETGGLLAAEIGYIDLMCENPVQFNPRQLAKGLIPITDGTSTLKTYDCSNVTEIPNYNPEFNYFDCETQNMLSPEAVDSTLNANISVYPNPTTGIMNIVFTDEIPIDNLVINIYDYMSNLIYTIDPVSSYNLNFNLPNCFPGLLTVQFNFNSGTYIFNKKILKQPVVHLDYK